MIQSAVNVNQAKPLPYGWRWVRLGEVCEEVYRYPTYYNIEYVEQGIPEIRGELIKEDGTLETDLTKYRFISKETSEGYSRTVLREGDFVLSVRGSMGKVALVPDELDGANMTANLIRISPNRTFIYSPFLKLVFLSIYFQSALEELSPQTTIKTIKALMLRSISIALPPLSEQKRIAANVQELMKEVEHARTVCKAQLEAAKALPQAYLRQVLESEEAKKWERRRLGEVCEIIMGQSPPGDTYNKSGEGLPFFQGKLDFGEIYPTVSFWCTHPQKIAEPGDVLISVRAPVGPTNLCNQKSCIGRGLAAIRSRNNGEPFFVLHFLRFIEKAVSEMGQGSTFGAIKRSDLESISFPYPPPTAQQRIATELNGKITSAEKLRAGIEKQLENIKALPQAILRKAFRGEL